MAQPVEPTKQEKRQTSGRRAFRAAAYAHFAPRGSVEYDAAVFMYVMYSWCNPLPPVPADVDGG